MKMQLEEMRAKLEKVGPVEGGPLGLGLTG